LNALRFLEIARIGLAQWARIGFAKPYVEENFP
jgi:hypothetical protein